MTLLHVNNLSAMFFSLFWYDWTKLVAESLLLFHYFTFKYCFFKSRSECLSIKWQKKIDTIKISIQFNNYKTIYWKNHCIWKLRDNDTFSVSVLSKLIDFFRTKFFYLLILFKSDVIFPYRQSGLTPIRYKRFTFNTKSKAT